MPKRLAKVAKVAKVAVVAKVTDESMGDEDEYFDDTDLSNDLSNCSLAKGKNSEGGSVDEEGTEEEDEVQDEEVEGMEDEVEEMEDEEAEEMEEIEDEEVEDENEDMEDLNKSKGNDDEDENEDSDNSDANEDLEDEAILFDEESNENIEAINVKKSAPKSKTVKPPHPKYSEMVYVAVSEGGNSRNGISLQLIKKRILADHNVSDKNLRQINTALKRSVLAGDIIQVKGAGASGSFKIPKAPPKKTLKTVTKKIETKKTIKKKVTEITPTKKKVVRKLPAEARSNKSPKKTVPDKKKAPIKVKLPTKKIISSKVSNKPAILKNVSKTSIIDKASTQQKNVIPMKSSDNKPKTISKKTLTKSSEKSLVAGKVKTPTKAKPLTKAKAATKTKSPAAKVSVSKVKPKTKPKAKK